MLVGTGVDVVMIPVVLDVDASTPGLTAVADDGVLLLQAVDAEVEVLASPAVLEDVAFALGNHSDEQSSLVKLGAGLASSAPIRVSTVVGPVESTTIEVQVSTEVKLDSACSDIGHNTGEEYTVTEIPFLTPR